MMSVAIPEDGRFAFAGVYKGSVEMQVFDLKNLYANS